MRNYCLRFALSPSLNFEPRMNALLDFCEKAKIDDVMFFIGAEDLYEGHITIERAKRYTNLILKAREILNKKGITISLNPWCTFSHYDAGRKLSADQNFRTMVDANGTKAEVVVCPLCENWQKYYIELLSFYVETLHPKVLWFEDDFRMSNHEPVWNGCFCDEHMKIYNSRLNTCYTREEFVERISYDERVRKVYIDVMKENIEEILQKFSEKINQPCFGIMTGGSGFQEGRDYDKLLPLLEKENKPFERICLYSYRQRGEQEYCWSVNKNSMLTRFTAGNKANCVTEIENVPDTLYTKSVNYFRCQMLTSLQMNFYGDTFSMFEFNGNGAIEYDKYAKMLAHIKPYLSAYEELKLSPENEKGVKILISKNSYYTYKCKNFFENSVQDCWLYAYLEQIGIACTHTFDKNIKNSIVGLSGQVLRNFTNEEIISIFENNMVILTGKNIDVLKERDLLYLIDVKNYKKYKENQGVQSMEELTTGEILYGIEKLRAIAHYFCGDYFCLEYNDNANKTEYTQLINYYEERVGAGITKVNNVLIFPYENIDTDQKVPISLICYLREHAIKKAISESEFNKDNYFVKEENVCPYAFEKDGTTYIVLSNFADDDYENIHLKTTLNYDSIEIMTVDNPEFKKAEFVLENGEYCLNEVLNAQHSVVLKIK